MGYALDIPGRVNGRGRQTIPLRVSVPSLLGGVMGHEAGVCWRPVAVMFQCPLRWAG